ncbi:MAG: GAF domain-containing protein [Acidobacteria bacterium]|nr:GAF domain-containing protein [Acidobacteriota bacterium]
MVAERSGAAPVVEEVRFTECDEAIFQHGGIPLRALEVAVRRCCELTGSSGAAAAIADGQRTVCRARSGSMAPDIGVEVPQHGLTSLSIRSRRLWRCDDAEGEPRADRTACQALGIRSMVIAPIVIPKRVLGVLEVFSPSPFAFDDYHSAAVQLVASALAIATVRGVSDNRSDFRRELLPPG